MRQVCIGGPQHDLDTDPTPKLMQTAYIYPACRDQPDLIAAATAWKQALLAARFAVAFDPVTDAAIRRHFDIHPPV